MNKNLLLLFIFFEFINITVYSQTSKSEIIVNSKSFIITVNPKEVNFKDENNGKFTIRNYYNFTDPSKPGTYKLPSQDLIIAIPPNSRPIVKILSEEKQEISNILPALNPSIKIKNDSSLIFQQVTYNQISGMEKAKPLLEVKGYFWLRDFYCMHLKINNYSYIAGDNKLTVFNNLKLEINIPQSNALLSNSPLVVKSDFDKEMKNILYNYSIAEQFRTSPKLLKSDSSFSWIDFNSTYLKIGVCEDGLYRITKSDLSNYGISTSAIDPETFQLLNKGKEIPVYVKGEGDGIFDDQDYIEFFATKNYSDISDRIINQPDQPYNNYLNKYTDTSYLFLTWGRKTGQRVKHISSYINDLTDTLNYYQFFNHYEQNEIFQPFYDDQTENQEPFWLRNKSWYFSQTKWLYSGTKRTYNFTPEDLVPNKTCSFYFKLVSGGSNNPTNSHNITLSINGNKIDSQVVNRYQQVLLQGSFNSNILNNGSPSSILVNNYNNGTTTNVVAEDWYEIEYPRFLNLINDSLYFTVPDNISKTTRIIKVGNATSNDLVVYKVNPTIKKFDSIVVSQGNLMFTDTVGADNKYIIEGQGKIRKPIFYYTKQFTNLTSSDNQTDYIAITNSKFLQSAQNYIKQISSLYSIKTELFDVQDIFDEFGYGYPTPESIKLFVEYGMQNWQEPKPSYLVLIGDADYDYKHYRFLNDGVVGGGNYVPAYGDPVSDCWYSIISDSLPIPQLMTGRIPVNNSSELDYYLSKVQNNYISQFNGWNKRYLFFSGGNGNSASEINLLKASNQSIIDNLITTKPVKGEYTHFYKTTDPQTDLGPYTQDQINNAISDGGVFISYIGHSGTATWDNGINTVDQLKNDVNRNPLMSDFGCSTLKFAEPDIVCFGERFLLGKDGQAIGYIGNSSLGFTSTATTVPLYFYESLFEDTLRNIGLAHLNAKIKMFNRLGTSNAYKVFAYTNSLLGDPVIDLKIPVKPNIKITPSDFLLSESPINENTDSVQLKIIVENLGTVTNDSVEIIISHFINNNSLGQDKLKIPLPDYLDTVSVWLKIKNLPGEHKVAVVLDPDNKINEIYKEDNSSSFTFTVSSVAVRDLLTQDEANPALKEIKLLNPADYPGDSLKIIYQISNDRNFNSPNQYTINAQPFVTDINIPSLTDSKRYWIRYKTDDPAAQYSTTRSFYNSNGPVYYLIDSLSFDSQNEDGVKFNISGVKLSNDSNVVSIISAGYYAGATCVISRNGKNLLSNSFFAGMGIAVIDKNTFAVDTAAWYQLFNNQTSMNQLVDFINSIPQGKIVAMGVSDDAANNITPNLKNAIKTLGSTKIDTLKFRGSWALIGEKGAAPNNVIEQIRGPYDGIIQIDSTFIIPNNYGTLITKEIGPAANWNSFKVTSSTPANSVIKYRVLGINSNDDIDSLSYLTVSGDSADLSFIKPQKYRRIKILSEFYSGNNNVSPEISSMGINFNTSPELGTNYQVVSLSKDSVIFGENESLQFYVYNAGGSPADSFNVKVDVVNPDNVHNTIFNSLVDSLNPGSRREFNVAYNTISGTGAKSFYINIDPENKIDELYKDNNVFSVPFFVKSDTSHPTLNVTFDGINIMDGDYVASNPKIKIELSDNSPLPVTDTSAVSIYLNGNPVYYSLNQTEISYSFNSSNPKYVVTYAPVLKDGEYSIKVIGKNSVGTLVDSAGYNKSFSVIGEPKLLNVYNYPNPFPKDTYFTFKLTQIPDELKIRIYTVAGRLVKEIEKHASDLNYDFNKIYWDGRDQDGDMLANGVYFYKITLVKGDKKDNVIQKMAIVR